MIITQEPDPPYDRPKLSKSLSSTGQELRLRPEEFYEESDIEVLTGRKVSRLDTEANKIHFDSNVDPLKYDKVSTVF